jgi:hypothetical protein
MKRRRRRRRNKIRKKAFETVKNTACPSPPFHHDTVSILYCRLLLQNTASFMAFTAPSVKITLLGYVALSFNNSVLAFQRSFLLPSLK